MRIYQILSSNILRKRTEINLEYWGFSRVIIVSVFYTSDIRSRFITITAFLSDGRQPEVDFLHHWAVVWLKLSGKSST